MLQDVVRTSLYQSAIMANSALAFRDKLVLDVGAGSGILSYFAVQAGAEKVYAVEASTMAAKIEKLVKSTSDTKNPYLRNRIQVIPSKIETPNLPIPKVDTLISEPIGVFLVHERMIESYLIARDRYLKPGGTMIPSSGNIFVAPFSDATLWTQTMAKVRFWEQNNFYGVDFSCLTRDAMDEIFGQPVVGNFDHRILSAPATSHHVDFKTISVQELQDFVIPVSWVSPFTGLIHGIASWFDINLGGYILTTAPNAERTHWQQVRFVLKEPLAVNAFETVRGWIRCSVNDLRSYTLTCELVVGTETPLSDPYATPIKLPLSTTAPTSSSTQPHNNSIPIQLDDQNNIHASLLLRKRRCEWHLHEQTYLYNYDTFQQDFSKPEFMCLYPGGTDGILNDGGLAPPNVPRNPPNVAFSNGGNGGGGSSGGMMSNGSVMIGMNQQFDGFGLEGGPGGDATML
ncbi:hypothetical protein SmJEL517_g05697 [Synchytrium microbalum]|uniref:type I protein arginine methyltransferase n=1 Tax=Synchytrium microbalum TaxID=1806994 RepID=A0A507BUD5_9FUNG|nr:uncharacterized protein SmJEL517_g05697 [Synchytrium microbalum]TPX30831.1 hypothetical protein SmJEL517_g05697 [Synchytrium microbalum]